MILRNTTSELLSKGKLNTVMAESILDSVAPELKKHLPKLEASIYFICCLIENGEDPRCHELTPEEIRILVILLENLPNESSIGFYLEIPIVLVRMVKLMNDIGWL